jgi:hypothetical protein
VTDNTDIWIHSLPIDFDENEAPKQYKFLLYLIDNYFDYLAGPGMKDLAHLVNLMIQFYRSPNSNDELNSEIEKIFVKISKIEAVKDKLSEIHETLNEEDRNKMEQCVSNTL